MCCVDHDLCGVMFVTALFVTGKQRMVEISMVKGYAVATNDAYRELAVTQAARAHTECWVQKKIRLWLVWLSGLSTSL